MQSATKVPLPNFLNFEEEKTNAGYETIIDFFLSYILRCSHSKFLVDYPLLYKYARTTVYYLIYGKNERNGYYIDPEEIPDGFQVIEVTTERQIKKKVDLLVKITLSKDGQPHKYLLNIENKFYTELKEHQLRAAAEFVKDNYQGFTIINLFITKDRSKNFANAIKWSIENDYKYLTIDDITSYWENGKTGNEIFDTIWSEL